MVGSTIFGNPSGPGLNLDDPVPAIGSHAMFHSLTVVENAGGGIVGCCSNGVIHFVGVVAAGNLVDDVHLTHNNLVSFENVQGDAVFAMGDLAGPPGWVQQMPALAVH